MALTMIICEIKKKRKIKLLKPGMVTIFAVFVLH